MHKYLFLVLLLISGSSAYSSHIVGGEFELLHVNNNRYRVTLNLYFDVLNGHHDAFDQFAEVRIFRKHDNARMQDMVLGFIGKSRVLYYQPVCSNGEVVTDKLIYSNTITLDDTIFNHPEGYYIAWERCCRNYTITNIQSNNPDIGGQYAGQTFYMEFPPVVKNGKPFINSSPQLFRPLNDYACPNRPYWFNAEGLDIDGDSLVYSIITPLSTHNKVPLPKNGPGAAPYPLVLWEETFSINNIMKGAPDLSISNDGFLTTTPTQEGIYSFAIKCEEFRDNEKIGEVVRDFQIFVLDICPVASPPKILGKKINDQVFSNSSTIVASFPNTVSDADRCIRVQVSDPDALSEVDSKTEKIYLKIIPIDFKTNQDLDEILPPVSSATLSNGSVKEFDLCFNKCPYLESGSFTIGVIAFDDACALPLSDTLYVDVTIDLPANTDPYFVTPNTSVSILEGDNYTLPIEGKDDDDNELSWNIITEGFSLSDLGMVFENQVLTNGKATATFKWTPNCATLIDANQTDFEIKVVLDDKNECDFINADTLILNLSAILPTNKIPQLTTSLSQLTFDHTLNTSLEFDIFGFDEDVDDIELTAEGEGFNLKDYGIHFPSILGQGNLEGHFSWTPSCDLLDSLEGNEVAIYFSLNDIYRCTPLGSVKKKVIIQLIPPENSIPEIQFLDLKTSAIITPDILPQLTIGESLIINVKGTDQDKNNDSIWLKLLTVNGEENYNDRFLFQNKSGVGTISSVLEWVPNCSDLNEGFEPKTHLLKFEVSDNKCANKKTDIVELSVSVKDVERKSTYFMPANVITPNGDGLNDTFSLPNMPADNCFNYFLVFTIYNRWGIKVFETNNRDFIWRGAKNVGTGVYYYTIHFNKNDYKGTINVLY